MTRPVLVAITSDQHTNSTLGLMPSQGVKLDEGNIALPNKAQEWSWDCWLDAHRGIDEFRREHKAKLIYVSNGDALDGNHHGTTQMISGNVESQAYIATEVFAIPKALKADAYYVVRGTPAHVGEGAASEEALAKHLRAVRDPVTDAWSRWKLALNIYGKVLDFRHHCSAGGQPWTKAAGISRLALKHKMTRIDAGLKPADIIIRSHIHEHLDSYDTVKGTRAIVTPPWQLLTSYGHQKATEAVPAIGAIGVLVWPNGKYHVEKWIYQLPEPEPEVVA